MITDDRQIFRAYDIRGIYKVEITEERAYEIGRSFGSFVGAGRTINVGRDTRDGSSSLSQSFIKGLIQVGCNAIDLGELPSPILYFSVPEMMSDAGCMVTASHLPPEWNGFKFCDRNGQIISEDSGLESIRSIYYLREYRDNKKGELSNEGAHTEILTYYRKSVEQHVRKSISSLKFVVDYSNSVTALSLPGLFSAIGFEPMEINKGVMAIPTHGLEPNHESMQMLRQAVINNNASLGIIYDADGDRMAFVDDEGTIYDGVALIALFALFLSEKGETGPIVMDVTCPTKLVDFIKGLGFIPLVSKVGHNYCSQMARINRALFAAQFSGHVSLKQSEYRDDAILASLLFLNYVSQLKVPLSKFMREKIPRMNYLMENIELGNVSTTPTMTSIREKAAAQYDHVDFLDGVKVIFPEGSFLIRPSNTSNIIRILAEGTTEGRMSQLLKKAESIVLEAMSHD